MASATVEFGAANLEAESPLITCLPVGARPEAGSLGLMLLDIIGPPLIRRRRPQ
jgi:hypothetical protein